MVDLKEAERALRLGVDQRDRKQKLIFSVSACFEDSRARACLKERFGLNGEEATELLKQLFEAKVIENASKEGGEYSHGIYLRFVKLGPSVQELREGGFGAKIVKEGMLESKKFLNYKSRYLMLDENDRVLYWFQSEESKYPLKTYSVPRCEVSIMECDSCKPGSYCFFFQTKEKRHLLCTNKSKEQLEWMEAIVSGGATLKEENLCNKASSIHEFEALDIDGNLVSLSKYAGKVLLVVNVASK